MRGIRVERLARQGCECLLQPLVLLLAGIEPGLERGAGRGFGGADLALRTQLGIPGQERGLQIPHLRAGAGEKDGERDGGGQQGKKGDHAISSLRASLPEGSDMHRSSCRISCEYRSPQ